MEQMGRLSSPLSFANRCTPTKSAVFESAPTRQNTIFLLFVGPQTLDSCGKWPYVEALFQPAHALQISSLEAPPTRNCSRSVAGSGVGARIREYVYVGYTIAGNGIVERSHALGRSGADGDECRG